MQDYVSSIWENLSKMFVLSFKNMRNLNLCEKDTCVHSEKEK